MDGLDARFQGGDLSAECVRRDRPLLHRALLTRCEHCGRSRSLGGFPHGRDRPAQGRDRSGGLRLTGASASDHWSPDPVRPLSAWEPDQRASCRSGAGAAVSPACALRAALPIWGSNWLALKIGTAAVPPGLFSGARWTTAGLALLLWRFSRGQDNRVSRRLLPRLLIVSALMVGLNALIQNYGLRLVSSGLAAVISAALTPISLLGFPCSPARSGSRCARQARSRSACWASRSCSVPKISLSLSARQA
ncbi:MAG: DMT family transporter [Acetobacteraceae bacterium]|nr:DMT family transporter [Acetobacteraceae bacterium]